MRLAEHRPVPRFALRRTEAADSVGVSPTKFDEWVKDGRMPRPVKVDGVVLWDAGEVQAAWIALRERDAGKMLDKLDDTWSDVDAA